MLYPTHHHPLLFPFKPHSLPSHPSTTTPLTPHLLSPPSPTQVEQEMEGVVGALKSSFRPETAVKRTPQHHPFIDDLWAVNGQTVGVSGDDFFVDDLLDFSKGGIEDGILETEEEEEEGAEHVEHTNPCSPSVSPQKQEKTKEFDPTGTYFSVVDDFGSLPHSELNVPAEDLADLEWLSHFVEDSFSEYSLTYPAAAAKLQAKPTENRSKPPEIPFPTASRFATPVHTKARSKRARTGGRVWSLGSPSLTESSSSSASSSSSTSSSLPSNPWLVYYADPSQTAESILGQLPAAAAQKRRNKKRETSHSGGTQQQQPRRCSHCLVQKTPQWRAGPLGAKTLCNACGVRFKSGRLLPEYRPACSPTFSSEVHSNNHRKVLEMRRNKDPETGLGPAVQSF